MGDRGRMSKEQEVVEELIDIMACLVGGRGLFTIDERLAKVDKELDEILEKEDNERIEKAINQSKKGIKWFFKEAENYA